MVDRIELSMINAYNLTREYGSPLYVYDETILRKRCKEIKEFLEYKYYVPSYSAKANSNIELLKIIRSEGFTTDAMSIGEVELELAAGFEPEEILFVSNNISIEEMQYVVGKEILLSIDSLSQLELYGKIAPNSKVAVRLNPGIGAGHHKNVITGGKSKFGILYENIPEIRKVAEKYGLIIVGINQHIGSLFLDGNEYLQASEKLLEAAMKFERLEFIDFGGGFGVPYHKQERRLDLKGLGKSLDELINNFLNQYNGKPIIKVEPGRYIIAECCQLLGTVMSDKINYGEKYVGTDVGFNVLMRPVLYDSYHEITTYTDEERTEKVTIVGNICESGDILAKDRELPVLKTGDIIGVENAGAYGYSMASNYNGRLRPAEVLLTKASEKQLIRKRDTIKALLEQI